MSWEYFDGGVAISPDGAYYVNGDRVWTPGDGGGDSSWRPNPVVAPVSSGADWGGGFSDFFSYLGKTGVDVWAQTTLMQQNLEGQKYLEGQRLEEAQRRNIMMSQQPGGIPPFFLLLGAGFLFYSLVSGD